jgi:hypothetical protein
MNLEKKRMSGPEQILRIFPPRDDRGRVRWSILREHPDYLMAYVQMEAAQFYGREKGLTQSLLQKKGHGWLANAIGTFYPGKWIQLKQHIGLEVLKKPKSYWTPEEIREQAKNFYEEQGKLTFGILEENGRTDISNAAVRKYPGGWRGLLKDLNLRPKAKPAGFWTPKQIEQQAYEFYQAQGELTQRLLYQHQRGDLIGGIAKHYPGGLRLLKTKLGIHSKVRPPGYWSPKVIEKEAAEFFSTHGKLTKDLLEQHGMSGLKHAIQLHYPGGYLALRGGLGLKNTQKPRGYWTVERIEEEALEAYRTHGRISNAYLYIIGRGDLAHAIARRYPGRIKALKEKLGAIGTESLSGVDEANLDLDKLLKI